MPRGDFFTVLTEVSLRLAGAVVAFTFHEWAHAITAFYFGDESQRDEKRLSLSPFTHVSWPGLLLVAVFGFGWARPVRVETHRLRNRRWNMVVISLAGCAMNLIISLAALALMLIVERNFPDWLWVNQVFYAVYIVSLSISLFNLIPLPPLDGFQAISAAAELDKRGDFSRLQNVGMLVAVVLMVTGALSSVMTPAIEGITRGMVAMLSALGL